MTINFTQIPSNIRAPLAYFEVNSNNSSVNSLNNKRILVLGQKLAGGSATAEVPVLVSSYEQAVTYFGEGSMLANMFEVLFKNNQFTEKWCCPSADVGGGTAATGTITVTGPATEDGTLSLYIGGVLVPVSVAASDTATEIGDAIEAAIEANGDLPVNASNTTGTVTITYKHKGTVGNYYNMQINYAGAPSGEKTPAGVGVAIVQLTSGATDPDLVDAFAALPEMIFDYVLHPYRATGVLDDLDDEMDSRWDALRMLEGHCFGAAGGTASAVEAIGAARNGKHSTILDAGLNSPTPSYLWAAALVGQVATSASADPALPMTTLPLLTVKPPQVVNQRSLSQRNSMLYSGIGTHIVEGGRVQLDRVITNYQTNTAGAPDATWLDVNTPLTISHLRQLLRSRITSKFARMKLADDGNAAFGSNVVTPSVIKGEIVAFMAEMKALNLVENIDVFKQSLIVERDLTDRTRINASIPPDLVNQFYIFAGNISFIL